MYDVIDVHKYRKPKMVLELLKLYDDEYKYLKSKWRFATRYMLQVSDPDGDEFATVQVVGLNLNKKSSAEKAFKMFIKAFKPQEVYGMMKGQELIVVEVKGRRKPKNWNQPIPKPKPKVPEFYALIPKHQDGQVKVMDVEPPEFVLDYSYIEGPFGSKEAVKKRLNKKKIPNFKRPKDFWNLEGY